MVVSDRWKWLRVCALACAVWALACNGFDEGLLHKSDAHAGEGGGGRPVPPDAGTNRDAAVPDGGGDGDGGLLVECVAEHPGCTRTHAVTACAQRACLLVECEAPWVDCDGDADNGCEATLDSLENCGLCGSACVLSNADARCYGGECVFAGCKPGFGDCDEAGGNGCEVALDTISDCGKCSEVCPALDNAAPGCNRGDCGVGTCLGLFGDCDESAGNGCEEPLRSNAHCGGCDTPCAPAYATGDCTGGSCAIVMCIDANVDCNGLATDGCEATLDSALHCGACGAACDLQHVTAPACAGAPLACAVDHSCSASGCSDGALENGCESGFGDCDGLGSNGCETQLDTLRDCGGCGDACSITNAISACNDGDCAFVGCEPGFDACSGSGACTSLASDTAHCGSCEVACGGGTPNCAGGACTSQVCTPGTADCNGIGTDGCEASLDDPSQCGLCDLECGPYPHATAACSARRCTIGSCNSGFRDCDGAVSNGCEVDIRTLEACGACDRTCSLAFAEESCSSGSCELVACEENHADCDGDPDNGCEVSTELPDHCGDCDTDCRGRAHVQSAGCNEGECEFVCDPGYGDCDGSVSNGCEADLASSAHCGSCDNDCGVLPHVASASCGDDNVCGKLMCDPGYGDCDGNPANGCERRVDTLSDCGACDQPCAPSHASGLCLLGACGTGTCDSGYADCNVNPTDGCEASLNDPETCGRCTNACADGLECGNGECLCTADAQCGHPSFDCCGGHCVNTNSVCSLWPCPVPATARPQQNCGGCGMTCLLFCCGALGE